MAAAGSDDLETEGGKCRDELLAGDPRQLRDSGESQPLESNEFELFGWFALNVQAELGGFTNSHRQLVE